MVVTCLKLNSDKWKDRRQRKKQYKWVINVYCRMQYQAREPLIDVITTIKRKEKGQQSKKTLLVPMYLPSPGEKCKFTLG